MNKRGTTDCSFLQLILDNLPVNAACCAAGQERYAGEIAFRHEFAGFAPAPPSAVRRDIVVETARGNNISPIGAAYSAPDGATAHLRAVDYKNAAPDGAAAKPAALSRDAIAKIDAVAADAREVRRVRAEALRNLKGGLRALYSTLELPGANPLKDARGVCAKSLAARRSPHRTPFP